MGRKFKKNMELLSSVLRRSTNSITEILLKEDNSNKASSGLEIISIRDYGNESQIQHNFEKTNFNFVKEAAKGLKKYTPKLTDEGTGGTYFLFNIEGDPVAIFKPIDEDQLSEKNPKLQEDDDGDNKPLFQGIKTGETAIREVFASKLDKHFSGVPTTFFVELWYDNVN